MRSRILSDEKLLPPEGGDLRRPCLLSFALLLVAASAAHSDCPSSCITILSDPAVCSSQPSDSASTGVPGQAAACSAAYDVFAGTMRASARSDCPHGLVRAIVDMREEYRIEGVPAGTPVTLEVRLRIKGGRCYTGCYSFGGAATGYLAHGAASVSVQIPHCGQYVRTLQLPVTVFAGDPFTIEASVAAWIFSGTSAVDGVLSFHGLPEGAQAVLCRNRVTPATTSTWGQVKAIYR